MKNSLVPTHLYAKKRFKSNFQQNIELETSNHNQLGLSFGDRIKLKWCSTPATYLGVGDTHEHHIAGKMLWFKADNHDGANFWGNITPKTKLSDLSYQITITKNANPSETYSDVALAKYLGKTMCSTISQFRNDQAIQLSAIIWLYSVAEITDNEASEIYKDYISKALKLVNLDGSSLKEIEEILKLTQAILSLKASPQDEYRTYLLNKGNLLKILYAHISKAKLANNQACENILGSAMISLFDDINVIWKQDRENEEHYPLLTFIISELSIEMLFPLKKDNSSLSAFWIEQQNKFLASINKKLIQELSFEFEQTISDLKFSNKNKTPDSLSLIEAHKDILSKSLRHFYPLVLNNYLIKSKNMTKIMEIHEKEYNSDKVWELKL